jgi:hypothetical protein
MADYEGSSESAVGRYVLKSLAGLFIGGVGGALLGAVVLILLVGPGDYARSVGSNRPAGIISGSGTESGFTLAITYVFAVWGAIIGGALGFSAGLFMAGKAPGGNTKASAT